MSNSDEIDRVTLTVSLSSVLRPSHRRQCRAKMNLIDIDNGVTAVRVTAVTTVQVTRSVSSRFDIDGCVTAVGVTALRPGQIRLDSVLTAVTLTSQPSACGPSNAGPADTTAFVGPEHSRRRPERTSIGLVAVCLQHKEKHVQKPRWRAEICASGPAQARERHADCQRLE